MVPTLSLPHIPGAAALSSKSSVRTSSSMNNKTSRINIASLVADASAQNSASSLECARAFCLRVAEWSGDPSRTVFNLDGFFLSWTFPAQSLSVQTGKNASCGSVVVRSRSHEKIPADWVPAKWRAHRFSRVHEPFRRLPRLLSASFGFELLVTAIVRHVVQAPHKSTVGSALLHCQFSIVVRGSSSARCWCRFAIRQLHAE